MPMRRTPPISKRAQQRQTTPTLHASYASTAPAAQPYSAARSTGMLFTNARQTTGQYTTTESIGMSIPSTATAQCMAYPGTTLLTHGTGTMDTDTSDGTTPPGVADTPHGTGRAAPGIGDTPMSGTLSDGVCTITITDLAHTDTAGTVLHTADTAMPYIQAETATPSVATMYPAPQVRQEPTEVYAPRHPAPTATTYHK